jgi:hypothetical protein
MSGERNERRKGGWRRRRKSVKWRNRNKAETMWPINKTEKRIEEESLCLLYLSLRLKKS